MGVDQLARERRPGEVQIIGGYHHERLAAGERLGRAVMNRMSSIPDSRYSCSMKSISGRSITGIILNLCTESIVKHGLAYDGLCLCVFLRLYQRFEERDKPLEVAHHNGVRFAQFHH